MPPTTKSRPSLRARAATASSKSAQNPTLPAGPRNRNTKKVARLFRRENLLTRVRDSGIAKPSSASRTSNNKRRRPGKKLAAAEEMGGMRDALPKLEDEEGWEGFSDASSANGTSGSGRRKRRRGEGEGKKIVMRSLKHKPGAMKRKRRMEDGERERFGRNLAQMVQGRRAEGVGEGSERTNGEAGEVGGGGAQKEKWEALRAFIGGTLVTDKAFGRG